MLASDFLIFFAIYFSYTTTTGLSAILAQKTRCLLCILVILPFAFYSDERVLFVFFGICFLHLELEGSMRDSSLLLLCVYSKSSFLRLFSVSLLPSVNCYISLI